MRDPRTEIEERVEFIRRTVEEQGKSAVALGVSGGKDSALTAYLCKQACENTTALIIPIDSAAAYSADGNDALKMCEKFKIKTLQANLIEAKDAIVKALSSSFELPEQAQDHINGRLRMIALYAFASANDALVAGTANRGKTYLGYASKYGSAAHDFNPIADLASREIDELLRYIEAPQEILDKESTLSPYVMSLLGVPDPNALYMLDEYLINGAAAVANEYAQRFREAHEAGGKAEAKFKQD